MPSRRCSCAFESHGLSPLTLGLGENEKAVSPRAAGSSGQSACQWRRVLDTQLRRLNVQCPRCSEGRRSAMLRKLQPQRHSLGHTCVMGQVVGSPSHSRVRQGTWKHVLAFQSGIPKSTEPRAQFSKQHLEASKEPCPSVSDGIQMVRCNGSNSLGVFLGMLSRLRLSPLTVTLSSSAWECRH